MEDEDAVSLSEIIKKLPQQSSPLGRNSVHHRHRSTSPVPKRVRSNSYRALEENERGNGKRTSVCRRSGKGEFVWAKAFPNTWWPGQIVGFKGRLVSVSFFGHSEIRSFDPSNIRGFEDSFPEIIKFIGMKLSEAIGLTLDEFARSNFNGLKCSCAASSMDNRPSLSVKNGFNPLEIFGFVIDKAVSPQVANGEIATVVRVSANIIAFRTTSSVCKTSEVDERFHAKGLLDLVVDMAIRPCTDDKKTDRFCKAVTQLNAFRRFASMKVDGFYQHSLEFMNDSLESCNIEACLEQPDCTSQDEIYQEMNMYPQVHVSVAPQEKNELLELNHKPEDEEICVINMMDIHFFDMDQNDWCQSTDIPHSCTEDPSVTPEIGPKVQQISAFSRARDAPQCSNEIPKIVPFEKTASQILADDQGQSAVIPHSFTQDASVNPEVGVECRQISSFSCSTRATQCSKQFPMEAFEETASQIPAYRRGQLAGIPHSCKKDASIKPAVEDRHLPAFLCTNNTFPCSNEIPHIAPLGKTVIQILANDRGQLAGLMHSCTKDASIKPAVEDRHLPAFLSTNNTVPCSNEIPHIAPLGKTAIPIPANDRGQLAGMMHSCTKDPSVRPEVRAEIKHISASNAGQFSDEVPQIAPLEKTASQILANDRLPTVGAEVRCISATSSTRNATQCSNEIPQPIPLEKTALQTLSKRNLSESSFKTWMLPQTSSKCISASGSVNPPQVNKGNDRDLSPVFSCRSDNSGRLSNHFATTSHLNHYCKSKWQAFYAAPLIKDGVQPTKRLNFDNSNCGSSINHLATKFPKDRNNCSTPRKKLTMKFPRDYKLPSEEELEKKFCVFGPLDHRKTKVFFYTGVGQVVFVHQADAVAAYKYVTRKPVFGQANMRFWLYKVENSKKEYGNNVPVALHSSLNVKTCLKKPSMPQPIDKRTNYRVRFSA